jgi:hypothetical protein
MSRWHNESCYRPDVYINGGSTPCCRGCGGSAETSLKSMEQTASTSFPPAPPDEPAGKMNLGWPSTVRYLQTRPDGTMIQVNLPAPQDEDHPLQPISTSTVSKGIESRPQTTTPTSPTYGGTLTLDQFRLVCLSAVDNESTAHFIHLTLEVHHDHNCPDYEATSYAWGGEDDDSSLLVIFSLYNSSR